MSEGLKKLLGRLSFVVVTLLVLGLGGYHFYSYYNDPLQYEVVLEHEVPRTITGMSITFRDELVIEDAPPGVENFLFDDAERAAVGQPVAEFHWYGSVGSDLRRLREIDSEIAMLESAQDTNVNNISNADAINRDIRDRLGMMVNIAGTGRCNNLERVRSDLTSLINRRQIAVGRAEDFAPRIEELRRERAGLGVSERGEVVRVSAPVPGFFSKHYDGYESLISPAMMSATSIADYIRLIEDPAPPSPSGHVGRMVTTGIWYTAVPLDLHLTEWLRRGQQVQLEFDSIARRIPATVHDIQLENNTDTMVAIFRSDFMSGEIINLRVSHVTIYAAQLTGLRVSTSALRFREGPDGETQLGVYVIDGNTIRFKLVYPVYREATFLISNPNPTVRITHDPDDSDASALQIPPPVRKYDHVITRGTDLYDGKPV